jgi:hypothetical protein
MGHLSGVRYDSEQVRARAAWKQSGHNGHGTSAVAPNLAILKKLHGLWLARVIQVAVRLGLPDLLGNGPKRLSELAMATESNEPTLHRLLRCLKHLGIITEIAPEFYGDTPLSERLQRDRADSLYWLSMLYGDEWQMRVWERLEDDVVTQTKQGKIIISSYTSLRGN